MITARSLTLLALSGTLLSGCFENEAACRDRLAEELDSNFRTTERMLNDPQTVTPRARILEMQMAILGEQGRLNQLYRSDSVSVCDFYLDGLSLVRK